MIVIDKEEVVEISSDFFCRFHGCINVELISIREGREHIRYRIYLNLGGKTELSCDSLTLLGNRGYVLNIFLDLLFHVVNRNGQFPYLILVLNLFGKLYIRRTFFGKVAGFFSNLLQRRKQKS